MGIEQIRNKTNIEEIDYCYLIDCLRSYSSPRAKITRLIKKGDLIRVKKGLYVFGPRYRKQMYSLEILANKIYGPSYISLEYALGYYGFIPEHVVEVTSVTCKRRRRYETPVGRFSYTPLPVKLYAVGFTMVPVVNDRTVLMASPEKALADLFYVRKIDIKTLIELKDLLFADLRLEERMVLRLRLGMLHNILKAGGNPALALLIEFLRNKR